MYIAVNSLMFARDLFGEIRDHLEITKLIPANIIHVPSR